MEQYKYPSYLEPWFLLKMVHIGCFTIVFSDSSVQDTLVNIFALGSRLGLAAGWTAQAVMTVEIYPTVIRFVKLITNY